MKPIQCPNKHFYDGEMYSQCPHCKKNGINSLNSAERFTPVSEERIEQGLTYKEANGGEKQKPKKRRFLSKRDKLEDVKNGGFQLHGDSADGKVDLKNPVYLNDEDTPTVALFELMVDNDKHLQSTDEVATDYSPIDGSKTSADKSLESENRARENHKKMTENTEDAADQKGDSKKDETEHRTDEITPLQKEISATGATSIRTDFKTVGFFSVQEDIDPVVAWLVCIEGNYLGESFKIKSGRNSIGREITMDISLMQETTVSRDKHAVLIYDPVNNGFIIQSGEGKGLTYLNNELVVTYATLKDRDIISMGKAKFLFVALCNGSFSWETYLNK